MGRTYTKINDAILARLRAIVGDENVLTSAEAREPYSHDEVAEIRHEPEAVVRVSTAQEVAGIMRLAQEAGFPVTPRGAGQGLSGGAVPAVGGLVLSLEKMNRILEIDQENLMATVEPGVITGNIHREVEALGLFYPPDPASLDSCSIGGNVAENAGGPRAVKYGVTRHYVCGLEAVLPSGDILQLGGKLVKDVTGYDLLQLLLGSEGTLAIVTKIILRLVPLPKVRVDLLVPFKDFRAASDTVSAIVDLAKKEAYFHGLATIEMIEQALASNPRGMPLVKQALVLIDGFRWLDEPSGWFRLLAICKHGLPKALDKVLAVAGG